MSAKNSIQVAIKVRPLLRREKDLSLSWRLTGNSIQLVESQAEPYFFDHIFNQDVTNQVIFDKMAKQIVHSTLQGFNGTIFAYGQTSSGKTYTMMGDDVNPGVMVLAAKEIFKEIVKSVDRQFLLRVGYIEIYNEKIYDLLNKKNQDLKIHETATGIVSVNCEESIITCEEDLLHHLCMGNKERTVGETNMNERSSRSHAIFRIIIESRKMERKEDDDAVIQSVLNLVDLAGSERADQTGARGARLKEGGHINKSLLFLSNVIKRLSENEDDKYISYRDSKLTRILQASLGGNAHTSIICTITPTAVEETQSTLSFAMRAKSIKNKPHVNEIVSDATMMKRLEREIQDLKTRLAAERERNESQIKVGQLELRLKTEVLKLISSNSLHNIRTQRERRRRTWCPATSNPEPAAIQPTTNSELQAPSSAPAIPSRLFLPKPSVYSTPQITFRPRSNDGPFSANIQPQIAEEEFFEPGESCIFDRSPLRSAAAMDLKTANGNQLRTVSLTPRATACSDNNLKTVEHALFELQEFTNLENKIDVKHESYDALKQKLEKVSSRNAILENERLEYIQTKDELNSTQQNLNDCEKRCDDLQIQISKVTKANQIATSKIAKYEEELGQLKQSIEKLEMENRDAISLDFEFQRHKNKSKLRENELIEALAEKDNEISKLEKSLNSMSDEKLQSSREELMQLSRNEYIAGQENVCVKCEDLQRLLDENKKVKLEFEKLTLLYESLQLNYKQANDEQAATKQSHSAPETEQTQECDELRAEIVALREKLEAMQCDYTQLNCDTNTKTEACVEEMRLLQEKYNKLEEAWNEQQVTINEIQSDYDAIQVKYQSLQTEYDRLELTSVQSLEDCARLQSENEGLQMEINDLKTRVEQARQRLMEGSTTSKPPAVVEDVKALKQENDSLRAELEEVQRQFEDMQREYDDLSNQLMDNLQEGETLKSQCNELEEELKLAKTFEATKKLLEDEVSGLKSQLEAVLAESKSISCKSFPSIAGELQSNGTTESMSSSGIYIEEEEIGSNAGAVEILTKFVQLSEALQEIELVEHTTGKSRIFTAKAVESPITTPLKLLLRNIAEITVSQQNDDLNVNGDSHVRMQGTLKRHTFHIVELESTENMGELAALECSPNTSEASEEVQLLQDAIAELKQQVEELSARNQSLCSEKNALLESTERTLNEMRDQITKLSAELFEKSLVVEQCEDYQKQIESLEKERAEMTMMFDELQEKANKTYSDDSLVANRTLCDEEVQAKDTKTSADYSVVNETMCVDDSQETELRKTVEAALQATVAKLRTELKIQVAILQSNAKMIDELQAQCQALEERCKAAESNVESIQTEYEQKLSDLRLNIENSEADQKCKEKEYKDECSRLQLEYYEKLELSESEFRDNLRNYNREWEEGKDNYEHTIESLKKQLDLQGSTCKCGTLQMQLEEKDNELKVKAEALAKCETEMEELSQEVLIKSQQIEDLKKRLESFEEENNLIKQEQESNEKTLKDEMARLKEFHERENQLAANTKLELERKLSEVQNELKALIEVVSRLENEKETLEQEKNSIQKFKADGGNQLLLLQQEISKLKELHESEKLEILNGKAEADSKSEQVYNELKELKEEQNKALRSKQELEEHQRLLQDELVKLKDSHEKEKREIGEAKTLSDNKLSELKVEIATLESERQVLENEKNAIVSCKQQQDESLKVLQADLSQLKELQIKLTEEKSQLQVAQQQLLLKNEELHDSIVEFTKAQQKLENEKSQLEAERLKALEQNANLLTEKETEAITISNLKSSCEGLTNEKDELLAKLSTAKGKLLAISQTDASQLELVQSLQEQLKNVDIHSQEQENTIETLKSSCERLQLEKGQLEEQLSSLSKEKEIGEEKLIEALENNSSGDTLIDSLREQLKTFETISKEKQILQESIEQLKLNHECSQELLKKEKETVASLLLQKKNLEERLHMTEITVENFETTSRQKEIFNEELKSTNERLLLEKTQLVERLNNVEVHSKEKENTIDTFKSSCGRLTLEKTQLEEKLSSLIEEKQIGEQKLIEALENNSCGNTLIDSLREQLQTFEANSRGKETINESLKSSNERLQLEKAQLGEQLSSRIEEKRLAEQKLIQALENNFRSDTLVASLREQLKTFESISSEKLVLQKSIEQLKLNHESSQELLKKEKETVASLLLQNKSLEERLHVTEITVKNFESELHTLQRKSGGSNNTSLDLNTSSSPRGRRSIERTIGDSQLKSINVKVEDKLSEKLHKSSHIESAERKNRRLSTHDERRRQSFWGATHDVGSMTDPSDNNCNCFELDRKLKECEKNLFIRVSQVTALNLELKNHPLKTEKAALIKRLQEEQDKNRLEVKRYRQKIEQMNKTAAASAAELAKLNKHQTPEAAETQTPPRILANAESQTESDIEASLQELLAKYNDLKTVCRHRYNVIKSLQEKVDQKENANGNVTMSSLEVGQMKALKRQCESLKADLETSKQKYEMAKVILQSRHEEIRKLRAELQAATTCT